MKHFATAAALSVLLTLGACQEKADAPAAAMAAVTETDATAAADATQVAWASKDVAKIEALYAKDVVAFDPMEAPLSTTWDNWHRLQQGFADMKFDKVSATDRKIQILDANTFIVSGTADLSSPDGPMKTAKMRFTDVYHRADDGKWWIVNEHVSMPPEAPPA